MNTEEKEAVLIALMTGLREQESWCGETHVQKAAYILQEGLKVPIGLDFVLYKHGPYSFDLHNLLGEMRADMLVTAQARSYPYGPTLEPTSNASHVETRHFGSRGSAPRQDQLPGLPACLTRSGLLGASRYGPLRDEEVLRDWSRAADAEDRLRETPHLRKISQQSPERKSMIS